MSEIPPKRTKTVGYGRERILMLGGKEIRCEDCRILFFLSALPVDQGVLEALHCPFCSSHRLSSK